MPKLLARTKLQSLNSAKLKALAQSDIDVVTKQLLQSHYTAEGSLEELTASINTKFYKWCKSKDEYEDYLGYLGFWDPWEHPYRWSYIFATYPIKFAFTFIRITRLDQPDFCVNYDMVDGKVHIGMDIKAVDATIVIRALSPDGDGDLGTVQSARGEDAAAILQHISKKERKDTAKEDFAGPNDTFPINDQDDVDSAAHLIGKAKNPNAVKARIKSIAKRKGLTLPEAWTNQETGRYRYGKRCHENQTRRRTCRCRASSRCLSRYTCWTFRR